MRHCEAHASVDQGNCGATSVRQCEAISQADQGSPEAMFVHQCEATTVAEQGKPGAYLRVPIASSKMDRHGLERQLPAVLEFVSNKLAQEQRVLLHCDAGIPLLPVRHTCN